MATRRETLAGLFAIGMAPRASWAAAGDPAYLTAALRPDGIYTLCGLSGNGEIVFERPLPARGHAAAAHPTAPIAVAFARRPGRFAMVTNCASGQEIARLEAPYDRHFYGHGIFSADGSVLYTTENDFEAARGIIGLWATDEGYRRIGEIGSGGVGPHDVLRLPDSDDLVVANGGIETHPDTGRAKLNLPVMRPNLTYLSPDGLHLDQVELTLDLQMNSIRHLAASPSGAIAFAMQWEGPVEEHPPLLGIHTRDEGVRLLSAPHDQQMRLQGYAGSVAFSNTAEAVAITAPRGNAAHVYSARSDLLLHNLDAEDVCGIASGQFAPFQLTTGAGLSGPLDHDGIWAPTRSPRHFDNHLVAIT